MRRAAILAALAAQLWGQREGRPDTALLERELKRLAEVYAIVEEQAADPVQPDQAFYAGAIPGMLRKLDPHSVFFDKDQFSQLKEMQTSVSKGFGSVVSVMPGRVIVLQTLPGAPAQKAGLEPGDEILAVNEIPLSRLDMDQLVGLLGQSRMQEVRLWVRRTGTEGLLTFTMTPEAMQSPSVDRSYSLGDGIVYIRVNSFEGETGKELREAIEKNGGRSMKGLVLDLRDNPGGVLDAALESAALFLKPGTPILTSRGRAAANKAIEAPKQGSPYEFPVAVLVNGKSASGAEIVAGALQDNDRATIVGEPSFGKGLVQSVFPLSGETGLALTTAYYYTPSGRSIQKPLRGGQLDDTTAAGAQPEYMTAGGRTVKGGGGITPDVMAYPQQPSRLGVVLEESASFAAFATDYVRPRRSVIARDFEVTAAVLDEFQLFLSRRNIRPTVAEWSADREWIGSRLRQEILNQSIGVEAGDEIEVRRDPVVRRAVAAVRQ